MTRGNRVEAQKLLDGLNDKLRRGWVPAQSLAVAYTGMGDKARALAALEKAYEEHAWYMTYLKVTPELDGLRSEPRFQAVLQRMKFLP